MNDRKTRMARPRRGFSLIELMIVVATIGLISSMALPSFQSFLLLAKRSERENLVQQIGRSTIAYLDTPSAATTFLADWNPPGAPNAGKRAFSTTVPGWSDLIGMPIGSVYHQFYVHVPIPGAPVTEFCIHAQSDLDGNGSVSTLVAKYTSDGKMWNRVDTLSGDSF